MNPTTKTYRQDLDLLKGIAIIAVILYHTGITPSGYLGVDVFLVINGFLIVPKVISDVKAGRFRYFPFLGKRIMRLLPLLLIVSAVTLCVGFFTMLPDDFENLSASIIASNLFSNNILSALTTKNYWDVVNEFKPLMHTWYVGIIFEFYIVFPLLVMATRWGAGKLKFSFSRGMWVIVALLSAISLLLYFCPDITTGNRFYLLHCRFFELAAGGAAGMWIAGNGGKNPLGRVSALLTFVILVFLLFAGVYGQEVASAVEYNITSGVNTTDYSIIPKLYLLPVVVLLTLCFVASKGMESRVIGFCCRLKSLNMLGMMSYSLFLWHQPYLAFQRYIFTEDWTALTLILFFVCVLTLSALTYRFVEKKITSLPRAGLITFVVFLLVNGAALAVYARAGVMRDVPELEISSSNKVRNPFAEFNDRIYKLNKDFTTPRGSTDRLNVYVVGNSFARDFANVLYEIPQASRLNLSYSFHFEEQYINRIKESDFIFFYGWKHDVPDFVWSNLPEGAQVWGIGTKSYGSSNGIIYSHRNDPDYFEQTTHINPNFFVINRMLKEEWQDRYVDLITPVTRPDSTIQVFSDDHKFLSKDCRHLTRAGVKFYASHINFDDIFK